MLILGVQSHQNDTKTSMLTQRWVENVFCHFYFKIIIVSVLRLCSWWVLACIIYGYNVFIPKIILMILCLHCFDRFGQFLFLVMVAQSQNIPCYDYPKISRLTQWWVHYYLFIIYYLNGFIVSVLRFFR